MILNKKGQTVIEYLILFVLIIIIASIVVCVQYSSENINKVKYNPDMHDCTAGTIDLEGNLIKCDDWQDKPYCELNPNDEKECFCEEYIYESNSDKFYYNKTKDYVWYDDVRGVINFEDKSNMNEVYFDYSIYIYVDYKYKLEYYDSICSAYYDPEWDAYFDDCNLGQRDYYKILKAIGCKQARPKTNFEKLNDTYDCASYGYSIEGKGVCIV